MVSLGLTVGGCAAAGRVVFCGGGRQDDSLNEIRSREKQVAGYMKVTLGTDDPIPLEERKDDWMLNNNMTIDDVSTTHIHPYTP